MLFVVVRWNEEFNWIFFCIINTEILGYWDLVLCDYFRYAESFFFSLSLFYLFNSFVSNKRTKSILLAYSMEKRIKKWFEWRILWVFFSFFNRILFVSRKLYWLSISLSLSLSLLLDLCVFAIWTLTHTHTHNENVTKQPNEKERKRSIFNSTNNNNPYTNCIIFSFKK